MQQKNLFEDGSLSRPAAVALAATAVVAPALAALGKRPSNSLSTKVWYALLRALADMVACSTWVWSPKPA